MSELCEEVDGEAADGSEVDEPGVDSDFEAELPVEGEQGESELGEDDALVEADSSPHFEPEAHNELPLENMECASQPVDEDDQVASQASGAESDEDGVESDGEGMPALEHPESPGSEGAEQPLHPDGVPKDIREMCTGLLTVLCREHPEIVKHLGWTVDLFPCHGIQCSVCAPAVSRVPRDYNLPVYMTHCEWSFEHYGLHANNWLASRDHWLLFQAKLDDVLKARCK